MIYLLIPADWLVGCIVLSLAKRWPDPMFPGNLTAGQAAFVCFEHIVSVFLWPLALLSVVWDKWIAPHEASWRIDYEGVELSVRESAARDIEAYCEMLLRDMPGEEWSSSRQVVEKMHTDMAKIVRNPHLLNREVLEDRLQGEEGDRA